MTPIKVLKRTISTSDFYNAVVRTRNKGKMEFIGLLNDIIDKFI